MKLIRISGQSKEELRHFYGLSHGWAGHWCKPIAAMLDLIVYLEEVVDYPSQWVFTSHENLVFAAQNDYRQKLVSVHPLGERLESPAQARYEIERPLEAPWSHATGYAEDAERTWQMIVSVLPKHPA